MIMKRSKSNATLNANVTESLNQQIINLNGQISQLDGKEEMYNQYYLNAKENPKSSGLFSRLGLRTIQDWVLAYFFFSYVVFAFLLILTVTKYALNKGVAALTIFSIALAIGTLMSVLLTYYG
jgi:hypothetical protein